MVSLKKNANIFSEATINDLVRGKIQSSTDLIVESRMRLHPAELDLVIFDPKSLCLINVEIKKNKWQKLFEQAIRGQLYCHYSTILVPLSAKQNIHLESFIEEGIGVIFYENIDDSKIDLHFEVEPKMSKRINRNFKKLVYREISSRVCPIL